MTTLRDIPLDQIIIGDRLRQIDPDWVVTLQDSVRAREAQMQPPLIHPITVRPQDDAFILVTGGHRVAAIKGLGHSTIQAIVQNLTDAAARLEEIDENLIRRNLTAFDRAAFLAERRAVYEALHPETRQGSEGGSGPLARYNRQIASRIHR